MAAQGFYSRVNTHVAVKAIRLSSTNMLEPGEVLKPGDLRVFHMRSLFKRRCIGIEGTPWANLQLDGLKAKEKKQVKKVEADKPKPVVKKDTKPKVKKSIKKVDKPWEHGNN